MMDKLPERIKQTHGKRLDRCPPDKRIEHLINLEPKLKKRQADE